MGLEGGRGELQLVRSCTGRSSAQELPPWIRSESVDLIEKVFPPSSQGRLPLLLAHPLCSLCQNSLEHVEGLEGVNISAIKSTIKKN